MRAPAAAERNLRSATENKDIYEASREELLKSLRTTLKEALTFNRQEALGQQELPSRKNTSLYEGEALLRHLKAHGCELLREGGRHSWWQNLKLSKRSQYHDIPKSTTYSS